MTWSKYYQNPITIEGLLGNLYGQREFLAAIHELAPKTILEVGSGSGGMAIFLSWLGFDVTSIDIEPAVVSKAQLENERLNGRAKFMVADSFALPYAAKEFDLVIHQGLLEHFPNDDIQKMVREQLRCASQVLFSVPNQFYMRRDFGNERLMSLAQWIQILSPFHVVMGRNYSPKRFPKPFLPKAKIQTMILVSGQE